MDKLIISAQGFPGATELLEFLESSTHDQINALVKALGNNVIFDGVVDTEGNSSAGWIIYNNEILPFEASATGETVVIVETVTEAAYDSSQTGNFNQILPVWKKRKAKFGNLGEADVVASFAFNTLTRVRSLQTLDGLLQQANEETLGLVEIATQDEANTTDNDTHALTPKKLNARNATTERRGVVEMATNSEILTGTDNERAVTIAALRTAGYRITKVTRGTVITDNRTNSDNQTYVNDFTKNNYELFPPTGYTMANLAGVHVGIAEVHFSGQVNSDDTLFCKYEILTDRIRMICNNNASRLNSKLNYIAIWQK